MRASEALAAGLSCKQPGKGWAIYPTGYGSFTLYPGDEGPQEARDLAEVLDWIGGDQEAVLTRGALKHLDELAREAQA